MAKNGKSFKYYPKTGLIATAVHIVLPKRNTKPGNYTVPCNEKLHKEPSVFARTLQMLCGTRTVCHGSRNI